MRIPTLSGTPTLSSPQFVEVMSRKGRSTEVAQPRERLLTRSTPSFSGAGRRITTLVLSCATMLTTTACGGGEQAEAPKQAVKLGEPSDDVDPELIGEAVRTNSRHFQMCYEQGRERNPELAGRVELRFLINPDGSIGQVMIVETDLPTQIADCVITAFYSLQMPRQESAVIAQYPMFFQPG